MFPQRRSEGGDGTGGQAGPVARSTGGAAGEEAYDPGPLAAPGLQQLEHPLVGPSRLPGEGPRDVVLEVEVADADGVGIAERDVGDLGRRPRSDAGKGLEAG